MNSERRRTLVDKKESKEKDELYKKRRRTMEEKKERVKRKINPVRKE